VNGTYEDAIIFALHHHGNQTRWNGDPYITHPLRVAARAAKIAGEHRWRFDAVDVDRIKKAAVLHDVIEDAAEDCRRLLYGEIDRKFGTNVAQFAWVLTRQKDQTYKQYIDEVVRAATSAGYTSALVIKKADLEDNLSNLPDDHGLQKRYQPALKKVTKALEKVLAE
jgi:(p)ppGpp synthase/HD superfamily hydrolase